MGLEPYLNSIGVSVSFEVLDTACLGQFGLDQAAQMGIRSAIQGHQGPVSPEAVRTLVICHTRELAYQIKHEFERFAKYFPVGRGEGERSGRSGEVETVVLPSMVWYIQKENWSELKWIYTAFP